ncbi:MAG: undecaprenyl-diphosphate phosphatase [Bacteroidia bacterium]
MTWLENVGLSILEGITEFLPVSSTGHLMMGSQLLGLEAESVDTYIISIQFGAIASVVLLYWERFFGPKAWHLYTRLLAGFIPAAILGLAFDDLLEQLLQTPAVVGIMLISVGVFLVFLDRLLPGGERNLDELSHKDAVIVGLVQCLAMIPGVSRSAATIAGGLGCRLSKKAAMEFSFLLAVPTLSAAGLYKLLKNWDALSSDELVDIALGNVLSFATALFAIRFFLKWVEHRGFAFFGFYRIVVGAAFLLYLAYL